MGKKFDDLVIALRIRCFNYEKCPETLATELVQAFSGMADPVYPTNGDESVNRVQRRNKRDWLISFLYSLMIKSHDLIQVLQNEKV